MIGVARAVAAAGGLATLGAAVILFVAAFLGPAGGNLLVRSLIVFGLAALGLVGAGLVGRRPGRAAGLLAAVAVALAVGAGWFALLGTPLLLLAALLATLGRGEARAAPPA